MRKPLATRRLRPELEATAYLLCAEALANVAKYASASRVEVEFAEREGRLVVVTRLATDIPLADEAH